MQEKVKIYNNGILIQVNIGFTTAIFKWYMGENEAKKYSQDLGI